MRLEPVCCRLQALSHPSACCASLSHPDAVDLPCAGVGLGGCVKLLLELQFLEAALPAYASQPAVDELLGHATDMLIEVIQVLDLVVRVYCCRGTANLPRDCPARCILDRSKLCDQYDLTRCWPTPLEQQQRVRV